MTAQHRTKAEIDLLREGYIEADMERWTPINRDHSDRVKQIAKEKAERKYPYPKKKVLAFVTTVDGQFYIRYNPVRAELEVNSKYNRIWSEDGWIPASLCSHNSSIALSDVMKLIEHRKNPQWIEVNDQD